MISLVKIERGTKTRGNQTFLSVGSLVSDLDLSQPNQQFVNCATVKSFLVPALYRVSRPARVAHIPCTLARFAVNRTRTATRFTLLLGSSKTNCFWVKING